MTKKDTIVIAGLVNAALLALLMIFTVDVEPKEMPPVVAKVEKPAPKPVKVEPVVITPPPVPKVATLDEGDEVLKVAEEKKAVDPVKPKEEWYVVKNGDSPWKIAKNNDTTTDEIMKLNHMSEEKAKSMRPGDKIRIR